MNSLAQPRINQASITHEWPKRLPDIVPYDQIGNVILFGGLVVDDHQSGAAILASIGKPAAGQTTSDDPIARNRSQCWASSVARRIASSGIACPNEMVAVFTGSSHTLQSGAPPISSKRRLTQVRS